jgi:predicted transcriptional regulator
VKIELDTDIRRLLFEQVTSYEQLEALLLLHARPQQQWTVDTVASALHVDAANAAAALDELTSQRLLARQEGLPGPDYCYSPAQPETARIVDRLAHAYSQQRLEVVKQMSANAIERVRSSAARTFSDAFIFRRKKDDR